jgi:D-alanine-D-alanine ligase
VEEAVPNLIEVTVPIMGNDQPRAALVERPLTNPEDFFDFDKKYLGQGKKGGGKKGGSAGAQGYSEIPAKLPGKLYEVAEHTALTVYKAIGCQGIARIDLLIDKKGEKVYFNEINPLPGSLYTHNWVKSGVSATELVTTLIHLAEERQAAQAKLSTSFDTSFLKQF